MVAKGRTHYIKVHERVRDPEMLLSASYVERGIIYKEPLFADEKLEIAILWLGPNAKIKKHEHTTDTELYYDIEGGHAEICPNGGSHELENIAEKDYWLSVLSVKRKV